MADDPQENQARFTHVFSSPLTAMRGALDLLRHPARLGGDPLTQDLLVTIERNYARLSAALAILLDHARVDTTQVEIHAPLDRFGIDVPAEAEPPAAPKPLPLKSAADQIGAAEQAETSANPAKDIIVIIADHGQHYEAIAAALDRAGYRTLLAGAGSAGIDLARAHHPALIMIDYELAVPGAAQIARILHDDPDTKKIPVLFTIDDQAQRDPARAQIDLVPLHESLTPLIELVDSTIATARSSASHAPTLLVVDDDTDIQRIVTLRLQQDGYRVIQASTGTEALLAAQRHTFDLIILDLLLPDIDGFSVLGALRARTATATTPIILLSARDSAPEKVRGLQLGADDYVTKPFSSAELQARVRAALRRYEREAGANPSTRLPGNIAIEHALQRRIEQSAPFAVCYADIDNFKAYNDTYSFLKGDAVIQHTAHVLLEAVQQWGNSDDFVGHIGGDDFVVITTPACATRIATAAIEQFDLLSPLFYDPITRSRGYIDAHDRQGQSARYAFVSLSIGIVSSERQPIEHVAAVAERSVEPKKRAKELPGSVYVFEE